VNERLLRLAERIRAELEELDRVVARVRHARDQQQRTGDDLYLDSVALNLHGFYAGLERLFELIATRVDGHICPKEPTGIRSCSCRCPRSARQPGRL
jgi:hypothetical protein